MLFCCQLSIVSLLSWRQKPGLLLSRGEGSLTLLAQCHPQPRTKHSTINAALLIDAPLREHKEPVTDCHKRLRRSEKRAAGACSRGLWIANVEHMKPVPGLRVPDFIMPPLSSLVISLFRHARLQQGPQLEPNSATLCSASKMLKTLCICTFNSARACRSFLEGTTSGKEDRECYTHSCYIVTSRNRRCATQTVLSSIGPFE